jgi:hypothetical protein
VKSFAMHSPSDQTSSLAVRIQRKLTGRVTRWAISCTRCENFGAEEGRRTRAVKAAILHARQKHASQADIVEIKRDAKR